MRKVTREDVLDLVAYEKIREEYRGRIIALKKRRRVTLGDRVSLTFENTQTALSQVQEMVRTERLVEPAAIDFEVGVYNAMIPAEGALSATMFIEITDAADIRKELDRFIGLDRPGTLSFALEKTGPVDAVFESGHSTTERISAVQYVTFPFRPDQIEEFRNGKGDVALVVRHPRYEARATLTPVVRAELARDFDLSH